MHYKGQLVRENILLIQSSFTKQKYNVNIIITKLKDCLVLPLDSMQEFLSIFFLVKVKKSLVEINHLPNNKMRLRTKQK